MKITLEVPPSIGRPDAFYTIFSIDLGNRSSDLGNAAVIFPNDGDHYILDKIQESDAVEVEGRGKLGGARFEWRKK